jgi:hypothetical protein
VWAVADWPLATAVAVGVLLSLTAAGAVVGLGAGLAGTGFGSKGFLGGIAGAWLSFAAFGGHTAVAVGNNDGGVFWTSAALLPVPLFFVCLLTRRLVGASTARISSVSSVQVAFAAKVALVSAVALGVAGAVLNIGGFDEAGGQDGFTVIAEVGIAGPVWWGFLIVLASGLSVARLGTWDRPAWLSSTGLLQAAWAGASAWLVLTIVLGSAVTVGGVAMADGRDERLAASIAGPVTVGNVGVAADSAALGTSVAIARSPFSATFGEIDDAETDRHISLFDFGLPPDDDAEAAPPWLWATLLAAPLAVAIAARRWFRGRDLANGGAVLGSGLSIAGGFAVAAWAGALLAPLVGGAYLIGGEEAPIIRAVVARPSVAATFGLALLAGLLGAGAVAAVVARQRGFPLLYAASSGRAVAHCPSCGAELRDEPAFCPSCGTNLSSGGD